MQESEKKPILKWWFTPKFPLRHYSDSVGIFKKWFANPLKRWMAKFYLQLLRSFTGIKVIGITGSAGKTTTKEILAGILMQKGKTVYSKANIDPIYNIPNTILKTPPGTKFLVLEMGVEFPMEMDFYMWLSKPDVAVITGIFPTHLQFFKNEDGVLAEKRKIVTGLNENATAVLNGDDYRLKTLAKKLVCKVKFFESHADALTQNINCAKTVASIFGIDAKSVKSELDKKFLPEHRFNWMKLKSGALVYDDSYNSNPKAVVSAIETFLSKAGKRKKVAVLGDMLELGDFEVKAHKDIGRKVAEKNFDVLIGVGPASLNMLTEARKHSGKLNTISLSDTATLMDELKPFMGPGYAILLKGSHSIGIYKVAEKLN